MTAAKHYGSCACGAVRFMVAGDLAAPDGCHCHLCRKTTGHFLVSTNAARDALTVEGIEHVRWWRSSARAQRGFCDTCGSTLFWDPADCDWISVAMGAFDDPTGTAIGLHIHVDDKGDYYSWPDEAPRYATVSPHAAGGE